MKVLEESLETGPRSYTFRCTSTRCRALLQAEEGDAKRSEYDPRDNVALLVFTCPRCGKDIYIDGSAYDKKGIQ